MAAPKGDIVDQALARARAMATKALATNPQVTQVALQVWRRLTAEEREAIGQAMFARYLRGLLGEARHVLRPTPGSNASLRWGQVVEMAKTGAIDAVLTIWVPSRGYVALLDCSAVDLEEAAADLHRRAGDMTARAEAYRALAREMRSKRAALVGDLAPGDIKAMIAGA